MSAATPRPSATATATASTSIASTHAAARSGISSISAGWRTPRSWRSTQAGTRLYSVHGDRSEATSYTVDRETGRLAVLNRQPTGGYNPIHLAFDATERFLVVSNYGSDSLAALPIAQGRCPRPLLHAHGGRRAAGTAPHRAEERAAASQSARSRRQDLLPALQGIGLRDRLPARCQTRRAGRDQPRRRPAERRAAPHRLPSAQGRSPT